MAISSDGQFLLLGGEEGIVQLFDLTVGKLSKELRGHSALVRATAISPDGKLGLSCSADKTAILWDLEKGRLIKQLADHDGIVTGAAFSPLGDRFVTCGFDGNLILWNTANTAKVRSYGYAADERPDVKTVQDLINLQGHTAWVRDVTFSPAGNRMYSVGNDGILFGWDSASANVTTRCFGNAGVLSCVSITSDNAFALTGGFDKTVRLWDLSSGKLVYTMTGHEHTVTAVVPHPHEDTALSAGMDGSLRLWDLTKGSQLWSLATGHAGGINGLVFTRDGRYAVTSGVDKTIRVWGLKAEDPKAPKAESPLELARSLRRKGRLSDAIAAYADLVGKLAPGDQAPQTLEVLREAAETYRAAGEYSRAVELYQRCRAVTEPQIKPQTRDAPQDLSELVQTWLFAGDFTAAEKELLASLRQRTTQLGAQHPAVADVHFALGQTYMELFDAVQAERHYQASLDLRKTALGPQHGDLAHSMQRVATTRLFRHNYADVESLLKQAHAMYSAIDGGPSARLAEVESELAELYQLTGRLEESPKMYQKSAETVVKAKDSEARPGLRVRHRYALALWQYRQYAGCEAVARQVLTFCERGLGPRDPEMPQILAVLSQVHDSLGNAAEAMRYLSRSGEIIEKRYGEEHLIFSFYLQRLGALHDRFGNLDQAELAYRRCVAIQRKKRAQQAFLPLIQLGAIHARKGDATKAMEEFDQGLRGLHAMMCQVLPIVPDASQSYILLMSKLAYAEPFLAAAGQPKNRDLVERSAEWVINLKGLAVEAAAERLLTARDTKDPETGKLAAELETVRNQIAGLSVGGAVFASAQPSSDVVDGLWVRERELSTKLGAATRRRTLSGSWITLGAVRERLKKGQVLVEFIKTGHRDFDATRTTGQRYLAWVIPPTGQGDVRLFDLGAVDPIDDAIRNYHNEIEASSVVLASGSEESAEARLRKAGQSVFSRVLGPLAEELEKSPHWVLSPDSETWLTPWAALPLADGKDGKYVIELHEVSCLLTGRELTSTYVGAKPSRPVVVANPDYDAGIAGGSDAFPALPGTAKEAEQILPKIARYTKNEPELYTQGRATEGVVKSLRGPQVLVISTHGFFQDSIVGGTLRNPLLQCGLALASANHAGNTIILSGDDGILLGLEAVGMDLRGTELVVLSACQSGLGKTVDGQGVKGFRESFHLAGARNVIATLWSIPDMETADLMSDFFNELVAGKSKSKALQAAQLTAIQSRRAKHKAAHPAFWAAFVLTGHDN